MASWKEKKRTQSARWSLGMFLIHNVCTPYTDYCDDFALISLQQRRKYKPRKELLKLNIMEIE